MGTPETNKPRVSPPRPFDQHPNDPIGGVGPAGRPMEIGVGVVTSLTATGCMLLLVGSLTIALSGELPLVQLGLIGVVGMLVWFFGDVSYRLFLNRPRRRGGLLPQGLPYGVSITVLALSVLLGGTAYHGGDGAGAAVAFAAKCALVGAVGLMIARQRKVSAVSV